MRNSVVCAMAQSDCAASNAPAIVARTAARCMQAFLKGTRSIHPPAPEEFAERVITPTPRLEEAAHHRRRLRWRRAPIGIIGAPDPLPVAIIAAIVIALIAAPLVASIIVAVARRQLILRVLDLAGGIAAGRLDKAAAGGALAGGVIGRRSHERFARLGRWAA